jgi:cytoskeleton protein RodZ
MAMAAQKTNADDGERPGQAGPEVHTPGALLQAARERAGMPREKVAARLNLLLSQVVALEEDRFERFPAETFVKGHLRSYARLLKMDVDQVLRAYHVLVPPTQVERRKSALRHRPQPLGAKPSRWRGYAGIAAVFVVLCGLWAWQQRRDQAQLLSLNAGSGQLPGGMESALYGDAESTLLDSVQLVPEPKPAPAAPVPAPTAATEGAGQQAAAPAGPTAAPAAPTAVDTDRLTLHFSADCWIEVKDRDDRILVATLKHADDRLQIEGRGPFKVLLGYAPGVEMAYNGAPVKVDAPPVGNRSTRLIVGNS